MWAPAGQAHSAAVNEISSALQQLAVMSHRGAAPIDEAFALLQPHAGKLVEQGCTVRCNNGNNTFRFDSFNGLSAHPTEDSACFFVDPPAMLKVPCTRSGVASGTSGVVSSASFQSVDGNQRCVVRFKPDLAASMYRGLDARLSEAELRSTALFVQAERQLADAQRSLAEATARRDEMRMLSQVSREQMRAVQSQLIRAQQDVILAEAAAKRRADELQVLTERLASSSTEVRNARAQVEAAAARLNAAQVNLAALQASESRSSQTVRAVQQQLSAQQALVLNAQGSVAAASAQLQRQRVDAQDAYDASIKAQRATGAQAALTAEQAARAQGLQEVRDTAQREQVAREQEAERQRLALIAAQQAERERIAREAAEAARLLQIRIQAEAEAAKVHCQVGAWGAWGACSNTCGSGSQIRRRPVVVQPAKGGTACPALEESQPCSDRTGCPVDCVMTPWGAWSSCSNTCGSGTQRRTRTVATEPRNGGAQCGPREEVVGCNDSSGCRQDCQATVSRGGCSAGCGPGSRTMTVNVTQPPRNGGAACPNGVTSTTSFSEPCNNGDCRVDCQYSTSVGGCSASCGPGQRYVQYNISRYPSNGGTACPQSGWQSCNDRPCQQNPSGSYARSCYGCSVGNGSLCCTCQRMDGGWQHTCSSGCWSYTNNNGNLQCGW